MRIWAASSGVHHRPAFITAPHPLTTAPHEPRGSLESPIQASEEPILNRAEQLPRHFEVDCPVQKHAWIGRNLHTGEKVFIKRKPSRIPLSIRFHNEVSLYRRLDAEFQRSPVVRVPRLLYAGRRNLFVLEFVRLSNDARMNQLRQSDAVRRAFLDGLVRFNSALRFQRSDIVQYVAGAAHNPVHVGISLALRNRRLLGRSLIMRAIRILRAASAKQRPVSQYLLHNDIKIRHNWALDEESRFVVFDLERAGMTRKWALFDVVSASYDPAFPAQLDLELVDGLLRRIPLPERQNLIVPSQIAVSVTLRAIARACSQPEERWLRALDIAMQWIEDDVLGRNDTRNSWNGEEWG